MDAGEDHGLLCQTPLISKCIVTTHKQSRWDECARLKDARLQQLEQLRDSRVRMQWLCRCRSPERIRHMPHDRLLWDISELNLVFTVQVYVWVRLQSCVYALHVWMKDTGTVPIYYAALPNSLLHDGYTTVRRPPSIWMVWVMGMNSCLYWYR
jgi:hypothetical protein